MAELSTIARPYAEAVFRVAQTRDLVAWSDALDRLAVAANHPDMRDVIGNPNIGDEQLAKLLLSVLDAGAPAEIGNFVRELGRNNRLLALPEIVGQFHALKNVREGSANARVISAFPLNDDQLSELVVSLEKKFGMKLKPSIEVDASLIGGVQVVVGDQVLDTSVRSRLEQMRSALMS